MRTKRTLSNMNVFITDTVLTVPEALALAFFFRAGQCNALHLPGTP
jgi:hypothetical protein